MSVSDSVVLFYNMRTKDDAMQGRCIIVGAGDINIGEIDQKEDDYIIAVDGGMLYCKVLGIKPDYYLGDFDSLEEAELQEICELERLHPECVKRLQPEKDDTDTISALRHGLALGYREFCIYAGMGGRLEHTIANLQSLIFLKNHGAKGYLMDAECMCLMLQDETISFQRELSGFLSLFVMGEMAEGVSISGMKYPLQKQKLTNDFPIGIDNEFIGETAEIAVEHGTLLAIVRWSE